MKTSPPTSGPTRTIRPTASTTTATATSTTSAAGTSTGNDNTTFDGTNDDHGTHVSGTIGGVGGNGKGVAGVCWSGQADQRQVPRPQRRHHRQRDQGGGLLHRPEDPPRPEHRRHQQLVGRRRLLAGACRTRSAAPTAPTSCSSPRPATAPTTTTPRPSYPSNYPNANVIAVASITSTGALSSFSQWGKTTVDIGAPGSGIYSTVPASPRARTSSRATPATAAPRWPPRT